MFDIKDKITELLPVDKRKRTIIAFLYRMLWKARDLQSKFVRLYNQQIYELPFTSQTLSLENRLNQRYGLPLGHIYILTVSPLFGATYIHFINENQTPFYAFCIAEAEPPQYVRFFAEHTNTSNADFIVYVPSSLLFDESELKAIVNTYRLVGKRFKVEIY